MPRGARRLPEACLRELEAADLIIHAGDFVAASVLAELEAIGPPVEAVRGNADDAELKRRLPLERVLEADGARVGVVHAPGPRAGRPERLRQRFPGCAAIVYGHTHVGEVAEVGGVWILNPGSPTERRRAPARSMLRLTVARGRVRPELLRLP